MPTNAGFHAARLLPAQISCHWSQHFPSPTCLRLLIVFALMVGAFSLAAADGAELVRNSLVPTAADTGRRGLPFTGDAGGVHRQSPASATTDTQTSGSADASSDQGSATGKPSTAALCALIERYARHHHLPPSYFTRLIWKESRFDRNAVSPKGAQGIAQFMPGTASERGLVDPFDPAEAILHSARFLQELHDRFGNIGLAAAAYNAGPQRVQNWLDGRGSLPAETQDYVYWITGRAAVNWQPAEAQDDSMADNVPGFDQGCPEFVSLASRGLISGPSNVGRRLQSVPQVARHPGHKLMSASSPSRQQAAEKPNSHGDDPVVARLARGQGKSLYSVQAGAQNHLQARKECIRLRATGSLCVVVVR